MKSLSFIGSVIAGLASFALTAGPVCAADKAEQKDWSVEVGSGALFANVRSSSSVTEGYMKIGRAHV